MTTKSILPNRAFQGVVGLNYQNNYKRGDKVFVTEAHKTSQSWARDVKPFSVGTIADFTRPRVAGKGWVIYAHVKFDGYIAPVPLEKIELVRVN